MSRQPITPQDAGALAFRLVAAFASGDPLMHEAVAAEADAHPDAWKAIALTLTGAAVAFLQNDAVEDVVDVAQRCILSSLGAGQPS